jgi:hypothetical protein
VAGTLIEGELEELLEALLEVLIKVTPWPFALNAAAFFLSNNRHL